MGGFPHAAYEMVITSQKMFKMLQEQNRRGTVTGKGETSHSKEESFPNKMETNAGTQQVGGLGAFHKMFLTPDCTAFRKC